MKKVSILLLLLALVLSVSAQDQDAMGQDEQAAAMKAWMDYMTPSDVHAALAKGVGEWKVKNTYWFTPGSEPQVTEGTAFGEMVLGGRYLLTKHSGTVMGMPFEGMSIEAYDNATEKYISIWIDNMGTGVAYAEGTYDKEAGQVVYEGTMTDPMTKAPSWFKEVVTHGENGGMVMKMYMKGPDGSEFQNMQIEFSK